MTIEEFMISFGVDRRLAARCIREKSGDEKFWELYLRVWGDINSQYRIGRDGKLYPLRPVRIPIEWRHE